MFVRWVYTRFFEHMKATDSKVTKVVGHPRDSDSSHNITLADSVEILKLCCHARKRKILEYLIIQSNKESVNLLNDHMNSVPSVLFNVCRYTSYTNF